MRELSRHFPHGGEAFLLLKMVGIPLGRLTQHQQEADQLVRVVGEKQGLDAHREQRAIAVSQHGGALGIRFLRIEGLMAEDVPDLVGRREERADGPAGEIGRVVAQQLGCSGIARRDEKRRIHKQRGRRIAQGQAHELILE